MLRFLQMLLFFGFNQVTTVAKTMCNQDYYGNCIEDKCVTWFDGNHTCDIIYENNTLVNMTCSDTLCKLQQSCTSLYKIRISFEFYM